MLFLLQILFNEYELILQMLIPFFKNYGELDATMDNLIARYRQGAIPNDVVSPNIEDIPVSRFTKNRSQFPD